MSEPQNQAAWLNKAGSPLQVGPAPLPKAGAGEIVVKNAAVAINPLDATMQDTGFFVQNWPAVIGCDVAGEVHAVGPDVDRFKPGDRVIGHAISLVTGRPANGAYALYTAIPADKAAVLPNHISFKDGVVIPFATEAAVCALCVKEPGPCLPGLMTPALGLPYPSLQSPGPAAGKSIVVYGASSSVGLTATQIATAAGVAVFAIAGVRNHNMVRSCGAVQVFDHKDESVVEKVIEAVKSSGSQLVGIVDTVSVPETYARDLRVLEKLGGGHLACMHPPPTENVPANVQTGMIFAVNDVVAPVYRDFVTPALQCGKLKPLPSPTVVGKGLEFIEEALQKYRGGVSATKLVVEL